MAETVNEEGLVSIGPITAEARITETRKAIRKATSRMNVVASRFDALVEALEEFQAIAGQLVELDSNLAHASKLNHFLLTVADARDRFSRWTEGTDGHSALTCAEAREALASQVLTLDEILAAAKLERIPAQGVDFNPEVHKATGVEATADPGQHRKIIAEIRAGYRRDGMLLRPAEVLVAIYQSQKESDDENKEE